jgi:DNA mismatch repair ATPase MutS
MLLLLQVLEQLVSKLLQHMPLLQRTLDNIALLDVLLSFFQAVTGRCGVPWSTLAPSHSLISTSWPHA